MIIYDFFCYNYTAKTNKFEGSFMSRSPDVYHVVKRGGRPIFLGNNSGLKISPCPCSVLRKPKISTNTW